MTENTYNKVFVKPGNGGWGKGLLLEPSETKNVVLSVTGGGIHPVAARIAELTGAEAVDGFTNSIPEERVVAVVINCGGTARIGVYPKKRMMTVDVFPGEPSGPLAKYITDDVFVSAVGTEDVELAGGSAAFATHAAEAAAASEAAIGSPAPSGAFGTSNVTHFTAETTTGGGFIGFFSNIATRFGSVIGNIINTLLSSGRQTVQLVLQTILPFMAYVSLLIGFVTYSGLSDLIAQAVTPLASNPIGLILLGVITGLPFLSPILGPGAAIAQVVGVLMGTQIAAGALPVQYALPTLFAINGQVGCDFVPVGLALGEAKPETVAVGVPAVLFSRLITSPLAVLIAWGASFALI
ncbi:PTS glucitol/sorbitol transporter subunit IIB [Salinibacterium sp. NSLL150]|uniref:PTS glucitol/sorbitol transporter subunit IIB n=1 Tax=unclassified Salinibacterium TaxID=2632331 RepID=UPI0018CD533E|nr:MULTISPECIES: PTS glucitol/sorbitol transporter subunit IIB [unclassified Salinibacterium]MBH0098393.1 PTS glucitol/sorbitol transporter subunit IIB [Salinibacterium sp. NSLL35]MBH0101148.1 PTS glucitol/sorbitol transporter subunit IIB [Salinibacterium sp. NSLL150]MBH0103907.1 PTS glucitol/sorbitol transporter subunit IIB [Salinibacterium sp. NSLL16]MBH0106668.1 PTS glucitol/sorbitol transporter subunit IIB [Salinibacterium sp. NSLL17]MBH0109561.1 PTS glucitol/sorbitol transporter subunit I